jgi:nucleotide-binding universal stress UspA family protein
VIKVYGCIDGLANSNAVIDGATWAALRLDAPLEFLRVLERPVLPAETPDYSGAIGLGAQESLLNELSQLDARQSKRAQEAGRQLLADARRRASAAGVTRLDARLRHGEFVDTVLEMQADARLFVLGEHHHTDPATRVHLDHHVEQVVRDVARPVLVVTGEIFEAPGRVVIAFDGSASAQQAVDAAAGNPLLSGLPVLLVMIDTQVIPNAAALQRFDAARLALQAAGHVVETVQLVGEPQTVLPPLLRQQRPALLLIGTYRHSRLRQLLFGSTTSTLLRSSEVPVLIPR